jgi:SagB-type dehydrogenase family enzyme
VVVIFLTCAGKGKQSKKLKSLPEQEIRLPLPSISGKISIEEVIQKRRTIRAFKNKPLDIKKLSQILWAAQGITDKDSKLRAAPSAGALFPIWVYIAIGKNSVEKIKEGVYKYRPERHTILKIREGDVLQKLALASLGQRWMKEAPIIIILTAQYSRVSIKYGQRGVRYAHIEVGHIGQNIFLQAEGIGLGAGIVGAFIDEAIINILKIPRDHRPLILMPVGYKK